MKPLTPTGLHQVFQRLGLQSKVPLNAVLCGPYTFRHTFSIDLFLAGGYVLALKELLGHTKLTRVAHYVHLTQADLEQQHPQFSPADRLKK